MSEQDKGEFADEINRIARRNTQLRSHLPRLTSINNYGLKDELQEPIGKAPELKTGEAASIIIAAQSTVKWNDFIAGKTISHNMGRAAQNLHKGMLVEVSRDVREDEGTVFKAEVVEAEIINNRTVLKLRKVKETQVEL